MGEVGLPRTTHKKGVEACDLAGTGISMVACACHHTGACRQQRRNPRERSPYEHNGLSVMSKA